MRLGVAQALVLDALYQVLDNKVFRVLVVVSATLALFPLLVQFRADEVVILFGYERLGYDELFRTVGQFFGVPLQAVAALSELEMRDLAVETYQTLLVEGLMGTVGLFLCVAATTFFLPTMLEKGTADTVFSKPVSRFSLLLARYLTGILFVGLLGGGLVLGTYLTLFLTSGYSDPTFLWSIPALVYTFALIYAVAMLVAVLSRSAVTALVVTFVFIPLNGCSHIAWKAIRMQTEVRELQAAEDGKEKEVEQAASSDGGGPLETFFKAFSAMHYVLPKTGDAMPLARKVRSTLRGDDFVFRDEDLDFELLSLPEGFEPLDASHHEALEDWAPASDVDEILFAAGHQGVRDEAVLLVRAHETREFPIGNSGRTRRESSRSVASDLEDWVEDGESRQMKSEDMVGVAEGTPWQRAARELEWTRETDGASWEVRTLILSEPEHIVTFQLQVREGWLEEHDDARRHFGGREYRFAGQQMSRQDPGLWYEARLDWDAPWRFNAFFSIGSSLGFAAVMILLSWWRLSRIDF